MQPDQTQGPALPGPATTNNGDGSVQPLLV